MNQRELCSQECEPPVGFEPTTCSLQVSCSTPELRWRLAIVPFLSPPFKSEVNDVGENLAQLCTERQLNVVAVKHALLDTNVVFGRDVFGSVRSSVFVLGDLVEEF